MAARTALKVIAPTTPVREITARQAEEVMRLAAQTSGYAANKCHKNLAAAWQWGKRLYDLPAVNPFAAVDRYPADQHPRRVPTMAEFWRVYAVADQADRAMLLALLYTAGRRSEPLRWIWEEDVDLASRRIRLSTCKTADGSRKYEWLTMPAKLHEALCNHKLTTGGHGHVFTSKSTGQPYTHRSRFVRELCKRAGVKPFNYHGIRGLCASLWAEGGVQMKEIQHILLHSSMTTTDRYIRRLGGANDMLAAAFDRFEETKTAGKVLPFSAAK